eukprot:757231-Hanusia_phi.AAC.4
METSKQALSISSEAHKVSRCQGHMRCPTELRQIAEECKRMVLSWRDSDAGHEDSMARVKKFVEDSKWHAQEGQADRSLVSEAAMLS